MISDGLSQFCLRSRGHHSSRRTPYNFKAISVFGHLYNSAEADIWSFYAYLTNNYSPAGGKGINGIARLETATTNPYHFNYRVTQESGLYNLICYSGPQGGYMAATGVSNAASAKMMIPVGRGNIQSIETHFSNTNKYHVEGDYIEIWGVRADG